MSQRSQKYGAKSQNTSEIRAFLFSPKTPYIRANPYKYGRLLYTAAYALKNSLILDWYIFVAQVRKIAVKFYPA